MNMQYCNYPVKRDIVPERDLIYVSEPIWLYLSMTYGGECVMRYSIEKKFLQLDRQPWLPRVLTTLVLYDEVVRQPRYLVLPRMATFEQMKLMVKDSFNWLREIPDGNFRLWRLYPDVRDQDFLD